MSATAVFSNEAMGRHPFVLEAATEEAGFPLWRDGTDFGSQATGVTKVASHSPWLSGAFKRLVELEHLEADWDSYGAEPPATSSIDLARQIVSSLSENDLKPSDIDPSAEGGVCISFCKGDRYADFECFNNRELLAVTSRGGDDTMVWAISDVDQDLGDAIDKLHEFLGR